MSVTKYSENGQVFTETITPYQPTSTSGALRGDFTNKCLAKPPLMQREGVGEDMRGQGVGVGAGTGAASLEAMCERRFLNSLDMLEVQSLEGVPERILEGLRGVVVMSGLESIRIWQIFTQAHPKTPPHHHKAYIKDPLQNAPLYTLPSRLDSPNLHWLTTLTLSNTSFSPDSMLHLASISNLVSLHISSNDTRTGQSLNDDVFRRWSRQACTAQGFPRLKFMFLRFQNGVTEHAFEFIDGFPRLSMLCTSRCRVSIREVKKILGGKGWKMSRNEFYAHMKTILEDSTYSLGYGRPWLAQVDRYTMSHARELGGEKPETPLLGLQLGSYDGARDSGMIYGIKEVECYIRDVEVSGVGKREGCVVVEEEGKEKETGPKRRKVRDRKKIELLDMLKGM